MSHTWEQAVVALRQEPARQDLVRAAYYDDPLPEAATRYWQSEEWRAVRAYLPRSRGTALDAGAGRGIASFALAKEGFHVAALEPDRSDVVGTGAIRRLARQTGLPIEVEESVLEDIPFRDAQFDVVFARAVLHHVSDLERTCREFHRVLKPGGVLIAVREHVISALEDLPQFLAAHPLHHLYGGEHAHLLATYREAISKAGLRLDCVLAPFQSPINFAPHTTRSLQAELARRAARLAPKMEGTFSHLLGIPQVWSIAKQLLQTVDNRPGRLYSFVARRP